MSKRVMFVLVVLVLSVSVVGEIETSEPLVNFFTDPLLNFNYVLALSQSGNDDNTCEANKYDSLFSVGPQSRTGDSFDAQVPASTQLSAGGGLEIFFGSPLELAFELAAGNVVMLGGMPYVRSEIQVSSDISCSWKNLPLHDIEGCYFLGGEVDITAQCGGWFIPKGGIVDASSSPPLERFFGANAPATENSHFGLNFDNKLDGGDHFFAGYDSGEEQQCLFNEYDIYSTDFAYVCTKQEDEFRWYVCDEEHLGQFVPANPIETEEDEAESNSPDLPMGFFCESALGGYTWEKRAITCDDPGVNCDSNQDVCESEENGFSYLQTGATGVCCGNDGIEDLGVILEGKKEGSDSNFICLNKNQPMVGGEIPNFECGTNDWCWVDSQSGGSEFKILTINKPANSFDVVSNTKKWVQCDQELADAGGQLPFRDLIEEGREGQPQHRTSVRSFQCYKEGNRYSWAECNTLGTLKNDNIKGRQSGEGTFAIPMQGQTGAELSPKYEAFYGPDTGVDFTGYDFFEFFVHFEEGSRPPVGVNLKLLGPDGAIYYDNNVLGFATNGVLFTDGNNIKMEENEFIHIKVPIPPLVNVQGVSITSNKDSNGIIVKNVYLSNSGSLLCSGKGSDTMSAWISDYDLNIPGFNVRGEEICEASFGPGSWQGDIDNAACCGDGSHEGGEEYFAIDPEKACWNSKVVEKGKTAMNVEYTVEYMEKDIELNLNPDAEYFVGAGTSEKVICNNGFSKEGVDCQGTESIPDAGPYSITFNPPIPINLIEVGVKEGGSGHPVWINAKDGNGDNFEWANRNRVGVAEYRELRPPKWVYQIDVSGDSNVAGEGLFQYLRYGVIDKHPTEFYDMVTAFESGVLREGFQNPIAEFSDPGIGGVSYTVESSKAAVDFYFYPDKTRNTITAEELKSEGKAYVMADVTIIPTINPEKAGADSPKPFTQPCTQSTCYYPLPGFPPYKITYDHAGLYDLFFVDSEGNEHKIIKDDPNQPFLTEGNLKATKVAQQVIYSSNEETGEQAFFGCNAGTLVSSHLDVDKNLANCAVKGPVDQEKFCSFGDNGLINSWSSETLLHTGYTAPDNADQFSLEDLAAELKIQPIDDIEKHIKPKDRTNQTKAVPGKNILPNAEWTEYSTDPGMRSNLLAWEVIPQQGSERGYMNDINTEGTFTLPDSIKSQKIAVPSSARLHFSQEGNAPVLIQAFDKEGTLVGDFQSPSTITLNPDAAFVELTFTAGTIKHPFLQILDGTPADYEEFSIDPPGRSGISCCQENHCWNGQACIGDMSGDSFLFEKIGDETYRCVKGEWSKLPVKLAWDYDTNNWGFCNSEEQCFVMKSSLGGNNDNTADTFLQGNFPICVNPNDKILDHQCVEGEWTSRTKTLAAELVNFLDGADEYVMYCTDHREALPDTEFQSEYLTGNAGGSAEDPEAFAEPTTHCFTEIENLDASLVPFKDNTCINNACVVKFTRGDNTYTGFGTTLNLPLDSPQSFLNTIEPGIGCPGGPGFVECQISGERKLWYSEELHAVIYGENMDIEGVRGNILQRFLSFFANLFRDETEFSKSEDFIKDAKNFRELYLVKGSDGKVVKAMKELHKNNESLVAEYENFETPVCDFVSHVTTEDPPLEFSLNCTTTDTTQRVEAVKKSTIDLLWPQLTGSLRVS